MYSLWFHLTTILFSLSWFDVLGLRLLSLVSIRALPALALFARGAWTARILSHFSSRRSCSRALCSRRSNCSYSLSFHLVTSLFALFALGARTARRISFHLGTSLLTLFPRGSRTEHTLFSFTSRWACSHSLCSSSSDFTKSLLSARDEPAFTLLARGARTALISCCFRCWSACSRTLRSTFECAYFR